MTTVMLESAEFPRSFVFAVKVAQDSSCTGTLAILSTATENDRGILPSGRIFGYVYRILAHRRLSAYDQTAAEYEGTVVPPQSLKTAAARQTPALPKVDDGKIDFDTIEALFFAYRDFVSDPDVILSKLEYGRAHHRVVYFVSRQPGMTVADLLDTLQITKQSLARVLKQLIDDGYIRQMAGPEDRRQRRLYPTLTGRELALALSEPQSRRIDRALEGLGPDARACVRKFLAQMRSPTTTTTVEDE